MSILMSCYHHIIAIHLSICTTLYVLNYSGTQFIAINYYYLIGNRKHCSPFQLRILTFLFRNDDSLVVVVSGARRKNNILSTEALPWQKLTALSSKTTRNNMQDDDDIDDNLISSNEYNINIILRRIFSVFCQEH